MEEMTTDYEITFTNGKDFETHIINYYDTDDYNDIKAYVMTYADDEASNFLSKCGYKIDTITKLT